MPKCCLIFLKTFCRLLFDGLARHNGKHQLTGLVENVSPSCAQINFDWTASVPLSISEKEA